MDDRWKIESTMRSLRQEQTMKKVSPVMKDEQKKTPYCQNTFQAVTIEKADWVLTRTGVITPAA
jgi:hypothetical protein